MEEHEPFVERILRKLVRKHIAGTTMDSALDAVRELNGESVPASITFLTGNVLDKSKAKYNATTYAELVRRIARSGIKSSIHVQLEQLGSDIDEQTAFDNVKTIADACNKYGIFLWVEPDGLNKQLSAKVSRLNGVGLVIDALRVDDYGKMGSLKLSFKDYNVDDPQEVAKTLSSVKKNVGNLVVSSMPEDLFWKVIKQKQKSDVVYEFGYGYGKGKIKKIQKKGAKVSILVPFGKDWVKYAMNNVPEGYMRFIASKLLKEEAI